MSLQKGKEKTVKFPKGKLLRFPQQPEEVKELLKLEILLQQELSRVDTFDERVAIRKELRQLKGELHEKING